LAFILWYVKDARKRRKRMSPNALETLKTLAALIAAFAAVLGGLYAVVTRPLQKELDAIQGKIQAESRAEFATFSMEMKGEFAAIRTEYNELRSELRAMETRLNERIETRIVRG